jgi:hypothetical protein
MAGFALPSRKEAVEGGEFGADDSECGSSMSQVIGQAGQRAAALQLPPVMRAAHRCETGCKDAIRMRGTFECSGVSSLESGDGADERV